LSIFNIAKNRNFSAAFDKKWVSEVTVLGGFQLKNADIGRNFEKNEKFAKKSKKKLAKLDSTVIMNNENMVFSS